MSKKKKRLIAGLICLIVIFSSLHFSDFFNASDSDVESGIESEALIGGETTETAVITETEDFVVTEAAAEITEAAAEITEAENVSTEAVEPDGDTSGENEENTEAVTEADTEENTAEIKTEITAASVFSRKTPYETLTKDEKREFYKKTLQNESDRNKFLKLTDSEVMSCFAMTREDLQKEASELLLRDTYNPWLAGLDEQDVLGVFGETELYASVFGTTETSESAEAAENEGAAEETTEETTTEAAESSTEAAETAAEASGEITGDISATTTEETPEEIPAETSESDSTTAEDAEAGTATDAAGSDVFDIISLFAAELSDDMPMLLAAGASSEFGFRFSATGEDEIKAHCINGDHPAIAVITSGTHSGKYIHCADSNNTSAFEWTNEAWHTNGRHWSFSTVDNGMADKLFEYYAGADPNDEDNQKSNSEYLQLTRDLTPLRTGSTRTAPHASAFVVKNGSNDVKNQTVKATFENGEQKTPTLTFSTGAKDVIYQSVTVPKDVTIHYLRDGSWRTVKGADNTKVILADGEQAYFSVPAGSSVTKVNVETKSVRADGTTGYYIGNQYLITPQFTVTNSSGATVTLQTFMFCDSERAGSGFELQFTSYGSVYLEKTSANPSFTDGCSIYTTKGIEYTVYSDAARTVPADAFKRNADGSFSATDPKFIIGDDNKSNALYFPIGVKYYYKETKTNDYFAMDTSPASRQNFTLATGNAATADVQIVPNNALKLSEQDSPVSDPVGLQLLKTDSEGITVANTTGDSPDTFTGPDLSGAVFRMDYYGDYYDTVNADGSITGAAPESTWYFQTKLNAATGEYQLRYLPNYLAPGYSSSAIKYNDEGFASLPLGTVVMYEAAPPQGYNNAGAMLDAAGAVDNQVFIGQVRPDGTGHASTFVSGAGDTFETNQTGQRVRVFTTAQAGTPVALAEEVTRVGFSVTKMDYVTYAEMEDVFFRVTSSTGESHYIKTGSKGFYSSEGVPHSKYTNAYDRLFDNDPSNDTIDGKNIAELDCGLWFYGTADEAEWSSDKIDDTKKACRYDEALVFTEIVTDANNGKQMIVNCTVSLTEDNVIKNLGVWTNVPDIQLSSLESDAATGTHASVPGTETVIKDIVSYKYLTAGNTYTLKGILMEKLEDGSVAPIKDAQGNLVRSNEVFTVDAGFVKTAQEKCGDVIVTFSFDSSNLAGKSFVVYEYLFDGSSPGLIETDGNTVKTDGAKINTAGEVISHADSEDENQTGVFYSIKTYASGESGTNLTEISRNMVINDSVSCTGLDAGYEYRLDGALKYVDRQGQIKDILDREGNPLIVSNHFTSENGNDVVKMAFPAFDGTQLLDKDGKQITGGIVVYEKLYWNNTLLVSHEDINDKDQTVFIPEIGTTATSENGTKTVYSRKNVTITDKVSYKYLVPEKKYTVKGTLMDKKTGRPLLDENGAEITAETTFTAETSDGSVNVVFTFDAVSLNTSTIVVFEHMYHDGVEIAAHTDINDEDQTVYVAKISTTARDESTGMQNGVIGEKAVIIDTISYENLEIGKNHTVIGYLMDKETGQMFTDGLLPVMATAVFTPHAKEGSVDVKFAFNSTELEGHELVVFEYVYTEDSKEPVATHEDINSVSQTISYTELKTTARDAATGTNTGRVAETVTIIDTVSYRNLIAGKEYTIKGTLMDKATGEPFTVNGEMVTAEKTFTAETPDGFTEISFTFNGSALEGKSIVVFERLYHEGIEVGSHADIEDEGQTIDFPPSGPPHTGDGTPIAAVAIAMLLAFGGIIATVVTKARSKRKD